MRRRLARPMADCGRTREVLRAVAWLGGAAWVMSWSVIGLEVFRWHHMTTSLHLNPPPQPPGLPPPRPGGFLIGSIVTSLVAPPVFLAASGWRCWRWLGRSDAARGTRRRRG